MSSSSSGLGLLGFGARNKGHTVEVFLGGRSTVYHVYKRPFVDYFLRKVSCSPPAVSHENPINGCQVSDWYTLVVFTASMQEYADPVIDWLDAGRGILSRRLFREASLLRSHDANFPHHDTEFLQSCTQLPNGSYIKDLSIIEQDLSRVCLVDNSPISYRGNEGTYTSIMTSAQFECLLPQQRMVYP